MQGRRFISAVEAEGERRLEEVLIKQLTGAGQKKLNKSSFFMHYFVHLSLDKHIKQIRVYKTTFSFVTNDV